MGGSAPHTPARGWQNLWTPSIGFQGPSAPGGDQKGQRPFDLVRVRYFGSELPDLRVTPRNPPMDGPLAVRPGPSMVLP